MIRVLDELEKKQVVHFFEHHGTVLMAIDPFPGDRVGNERYGPRRRPSSGAAHTPEIAATQPTASPGASAAYLDTVKHVVAETARKLDQSLVGDLDAPRDLPVEDDDFPDDFLEPPKNDPV